MTRDPRIDPRLGDRIEYPAGSGCHLCVEGVSNGYVRVVNVSDDVDKWLRLSTFQRLVAGQRVLSVAKEERT